MQIRLQNTVKTLKSFNLVGDSSLLNLRWSILLALLKLSNINPLLELCYWHKYKIIEYFRSPKSLSPWQKGNNKSFFNISRSEWHDQCGGLDRKLIVKFTKHPGGNVIVQIDKFQCGDANMFRSILFVAEIPSLLKIYVWERENVYTINFLTKPWYCIIRNRVVVITIYQGIYAFMYMYTTLG